MKQEIGKCIKAQFVFDKNCGFAIYLDFTLDTTSMANSVSFYITDLIQTREILDMLNKDKTGYAKSAIDARDLKKLVGRTAKILSGGLGSKCYFEGWVQKGVTKHE